MKMRQKVNIPKWCKVWANQECSMGKNNWVVPRLVELAKDCEIFDLPLIHINLLNLEPEINSLLEFLSHVKAIENADLKYPIILGPNGEILDGRHRVAKAILLKKYSIKAKRIEVMPEPDRIDKE